jgi:DNA end-binding protein Ku
MPRAFWKGSLSFGLVEIPVSLRPAVEADELSFTLLDRKGFSPIGYKRYNKNTGRDVPWDQVIRGYEYEPGEYVVLSDEELKQANVKATQSIEISEFIEGDEIDGVFYEAPYYVEPLKKGSKSYTLLREALDRTGRVGIARIVLRTRQRVAVLVVRGDALVLNLLRYAHEIRGAEGLEVPSKRGASLSAREVQLAERLIGEMTGKWNPSEFRDTYRDDVLALVQRKIKSGQTHTIVEPERAREKRAPRTDLVDLMPLLKRSLAERAAAASTAPRGRTRARRASPSRPGTRTAARRQKKSA